jgi:hypothetical protein
MNLIAEVVRKNGQSSLLTEGRPGLIQDLLGNPLFGHHVCSEMARSGITFLIPCATDQFVGGCRRQAPRLFHVTCVHTHHGADPICVRGRNAGAAQLAHPTRSANSIRRGSCLAERIGDMDVTAEANDKGKVKISKIGEQLVVAHPAAGQEDLR